MDIAPRYEAAPRRACLQAKQDTKSEPDIAAEPSAALKSRDDGMQAAAQNADQCGIGVGLERGGGVAVRVDAAVAILDRQHPDIGPGRHQSDPTG
jgi:hypothetical protein